MDIQNDRSKKPELNDVWLYTTAKGERKPGLVIRQGVNFANHTLVQNKIFHLRPIGTSLTTRGYSEFEFEEADRFSFICKAVSDEDSFIMHGERFLITDSQQDSLIAFIEIGVVLSSPKKTMSKVSFYQLVFDGTIKLVNDSSPKSINSSIIQRMADYMVIDDVTERKKSMEVITIQSMKIGGFFLQDDNYVFFVRPFDEISGLFILEDVEGRKIRFKFNDIFKENGDVLSSFRYRFFNSDIRPFQRFQSRRSSGAIIFVKSFFDYQKGRGGRPEVNSPFVVFRREGRFDDLTVRALEFYNDIKKMVLIAIDSHNDSFGFDIRRRIAQLEYPNDAVDAMSFALARHTDMHISDEMTWPVWEGARRMGKSNQENLFRGMNHLISASITDADDKLFPKKTKKALSKISKSKRVGFSHENSIDKIKSKNLTPSLGFECVIKIPKINSINTVGEELKIKQSAKI